MGDDREPLSIELPEVGEAVNAAVSRVTGLEKRYRVAERPVARLPVECEDCEWEFRIAVYPEDIDVSRVLPDERRLAEAVLSALHVRGWRIVRDG